MNGARRTSVFFCLVSVALIGGCAQSPTTVEPQPPKCGNAVLEEGEACDGPDLGGHSCQDQGFVTGVLACSADCILDTSGCSQGPSCGNGVVEGQESCDGTDLFGKSCKDEGFVTGTLACTGNCTFDTSGCSMVEGCGNAKIDQGESCDSTDLGEETCASQGFDGGTLACGDDCTFDTTGCFGCGNGVKEGTESCDGTDLGSQTCEGLSHDGGTLACGDDCIFDESGCFDCGNGIKEGTESCDGTDLGNQTCEGLGHDGGTLTCKDDCTLDESACTDASVCGDGTVAGTEECDDGNTTAGDGCSATCTWENQCTQQKTIACGGSDSDSESSSDHVSGYNCSGLSYTERDTIYQFQVTADQSVTVHLQISDSSDDLDLIVLGGACHPKLCIGISNGTSTAEDVTFNAHAGWTYYFVVEFYYVSAWGDYTLSVSCQ